MSIQNNRAAEVLYSTTYVEDYLDTVENLPDEIQRLLSRLMLLDADSKKFFGQVRDYFAQLVRLKNRNRRSDNEDLTTEIGRIHGNITVTLMKSQEIGDEKIQVAQQIQDFVDNRLRQLEVDRKTLDSVQKQADAVEAASASPYSTRDRDVPQRLGSNDNIASERTMKRVRRVRLGPSIIPNKPSTVSASTALQQNIASNCEKQRPEVTSSSVGTSVPPPPEVSSSSTATSSAVTTVQSEKEKPKEKAKPTPQQHTPGPPVVTSEDKRRDSAASTLVSVLPTLPVKKRVNEVETVSTPVQELQPETPERKTDLVLRTPKKKEKKLSAVVQKQNERKASSGSTSSATKRTTAKRKAQQDGGISNADPDEATYCICVQISYGDMIGCDNDLCPIEWFHFSCVQLSSKPKGKWYCPSCRDGKANVMKPKEVFLKELEQYNREREGR